MGPCLQICRYMEEGGGGEGVGCGGGGSGAGGGDHTLLKSAESWHVIFL